MTGWRLGLFPARRGTGRCRWRKTTRGSQQSLVRLCKQAIVTVTYDTEFSVDYFLPDPTRAYSVTRAVRIAEVQNPGKSNEQELPPGQDHGYMWRFNLYTRYLERDNGVYLQIEFLALSRTVPTFFAWLVNPYIRSVPREYLTHFVLVTRRELTPATGGTQQCCALRKESKRPAWEGGA